MKRVILFAATALLIGSAQAQFKPAGGDFCIELQFRPLGNDIIEGTSFEFDLGSTTIPMFGISPRFFVLDNLELKADLLFGTISAKDSPTQDIGNGNVTQTTKTNFVGFGLNLGVNYHFSGTERISPYVGVDLGFYTGSVSQKITNAGFVTGDSGKGKSGLFGLGFNVLTGFNWYIVDGLYLGAEIGLGLAFAKEGKTVNETKIGGTTTSTTVDPTSSGIVVGFAANPALRLGWKF